MILETIQGAKVTFLFISGNVTINVGLINYAFFRQLPGKGQLSLLQQLQLLTFLLGLWFRTS